ncbi:ABC transporter substrate-binding protein [Bacillus sp. B15-48]|uniref:ABC transporter substrate-binding protein n=1 Tax=Bacillus sp. B15-48 TaxID=1548601 RepID=UPI00194000EC|nr:ABC transporter substrate-binding protein [Bacillus sp. B15-48]MBM4763062.1 hypothetical protein [Bacillus sp. B15-48]
MKTKWYLFFLTIITVSIVIINLISIEKNATYKIGVLSAGESRQEKYLGLQEGLAELGYKDEDFTFIVKDAVDDIDVLNNHIDEILSEEVDLIVTLGGIETIQLQKKLAEVNLELPVVFAGIADPQEIGIIADHRSPGNYFTGINNFHTSLSGKRLELFQALIPNLERVFAVYDQSVEASKRSLELSLKAAQQLHIEVIPVDATNPAYRELIEKQIKTHDALFILPSYYIESLTEEIVQFSNQYRLPVMGLYENEVKSGYAASYGTSFFDQGYQAARFVSSIIQGNSPSELPVELPDRLRFIVNKQVVERYNSVINQDLLSIAEFIEEAAEGEER